jgi:hypothetical protein
MGKPRERLSASCSANDITKGGKGGREKERARCVRLIAGHSARALFFI